MKADNHDDQIERRPSAPDLRREGWIDVTVIGDSYLKYMSPNGRKILVTRNRIGEEHLEFNLGPLY